MSKDDDLGVYALVLAYSTREGRVYNIMEIVVGGLVEFTQAVKDIESRLSENTKPEDLTAFDITHRLGELGYKVVPIGEE